MPYLDNRVLDNGLSALSSEVNALRICNAEPATYAAATSTNSLGVKTSPSIAAPSNRTPSGRKVTVAAIVSGSPGSISVTGTASHWALVDTVNSRLLAAGALGASQGVTDGNTFTLSAFDIGIPAAA